MFYNGFTIRFHNVKLPEAGPTDPIRTVSHLSRIYGCETLKPKVKPKVKPPFYNCKLLISNFL